MNAAVIGREAELAAIETFLAAVEQGPRALVLSGEPGIGKTILWETGVEHARERFGAVLTCRGVEAEASLSFAALSELLAPVFDEVAASLLPPRRRALEIALLRVEPGDVAPDAHAIGLAVLDLLSTLAERGPVLVALDDLQWLDPASAGVLQIALRRLREEPVGVLVTVRTGPDVTMPFELERSFVEQRLEQLGIDPLSLGAVHGLLLERLGLDLTRPELARVQEATAGNPFFALELGRELVRTGTRPAPGQPLRVPESLRELLGGRLARLPGETLDVLLQVAALARPTVELVAATYGEQERVLEALEAAAQEAVVELDGTSIRFTHPLLASICYEQAPLWKRRAVHRALASAVADVEERARHLALAAEGPDAAIASELESAAENAAARGAPGAAAELCELAAQLAPDDPFLMRRRRLRAAELYRLAGDFDRAFDLYEDLLAEVPPGVERSDVLFGLALTQRADTPVLDAFYEQARAEAAGDDARLARILAWQMGIHLYRADARAALVDARAALEKAERAGDSYLLAVTIARAGHAEAYADEVTPGLLERGVEIEEREGLLLETDESPRYSFARLLARLGELDKARALFEELEAATIERGDEGSRVMVLWPLGMLEWQAGRWQRALELANAAYELTEHTQHPRGRAWVGRAKALVEADLGLVDEARASAAEAIAFCEETSKEYFEIVALGVLGHLELELGNLHAAGDYLRELPERLFEGGFNDPSLAVWADALETLIGLGELERAREYLERYELHAGRLGSPPARAGAARCRGLLLAAEGQLEPALDALDRSLADAQPFPIERARSLLCLGVVRRQAQQKKAARESLEQSLAILEELGAPLWAERARAELRRISGRAPASDDELTEAERRVAELAAAGRTNKEIAAELFMGVSTVEAHLSRVYRKLGIRSRTELAAQLAIPRDEAVQA
ncbi:MAG TPA: AAA family ATPase [Gaiellaceae bacterium]|nr:AAA family ATPase [Gaiellaceae bacterium]